MQGMAYKALKERFEKLVDATALIARHKGGTLPSFVTQIKGQVDDLIGKDSAEKLNVHQELELSLILVGAYFVGKEKEKANDGAKRVGRGKKAPKAAQPRNVQADAGGLRKAGNGNGAVSAEGGTDDQGGEHDHEGGHDPLSAVQV